MIIIIGLGAEKEGVVVGRAVNDERVGFGVRAGVVDVGLPVDVAETIAWLSQPGSAGVNGQVVRVCGQSMLGA